MSSVMLPVNLGLECASTRSSTVVSLPLTASSRTFLIFLTVFDSPALATFATSVCPTAAPSVPMPSISPESDETSPGLPSSAAATPRSTLTAVPYMCAGPPVNTPMMPNATA